MIVPVSVTLGEDNQEILPLQQNGFAYVCKYKSTQLHQDARPWHWHDALAFNRVVQGNVEFQTPFGTYHLQAGEAIFVNTNVLHMLKYGQASCTELYFHVFETEFLTGGYNPAFEEEFFSSVLYNKELPVYIIRPDSPQNRAILEKLCRIEELARSEPYGYQWYIRACLCEVWLLFLQQTDAQRRGGKAREHADVRRIKLMMEYVHRHYAQPLTLSQIADSANIGQRECARCFNRCIQISPMRYLADYRVRQAAHMLIQTDESVQYISEACGFSSASYFTKVFAQIMGCSPREYRKKSG